MQAVQSVSKTNCHDQRLRLGDGRWLGYAEYGDLKGRPVFLLHGIPGSRRLRHPDESVARSLGVRLIVPERPGFGLSDFQPGRRLLDWPADLAALAGALGAERFAVAGLSAGGSYALACAWAIPGRLTAVAIVSGASPAWQLPFGQRLSLGTHLLRQAPRLAAAFVGLVCHRPDLATRLTATLLPAADRTVLAQPDMRRMQQENVAEATHSGVCGLLWDTWLLARPWGFRLEEVAVPVRLWHGGRDANVPWPMGQHLAQRIPNCRVRFLPEAGHWLLFSHWQAILSGLVG